MTHPGDVPEMVEQARLLEQAIGLAVALHAGQTDKAGAPYILHPLRVMLAMRTLEEKTVAVLHDVVEDCPAFTLDRLSGFPAPIVEAIDALTRREGESYTTFIQRLAPNRLARAVKLEDLFDNMNLSRLPEITDAVVRRHDKYARAHRFLSDFPALSPTGRGER